MRPRDESAHPVIEDAVARGYLNSGIPYSIDEFTTHDAANKGRLAVKRAGDHLNVSTPCWVVDQAGESCWKNCQDPSAPHGVRFRLYSREAARQHVVQQTGGDPANLRWNPFARQQGPLLDDAGRPL